MRSHHIQHIRQQVKASYAAIADEFDNTRQKLWEEFYHFLAYVKTRGRVLDLGCGNGRLAGLLETKFVDYWGIDNNAALLEKAKKNFPQGRFIRGDWGDMMDLKELSKEAFDLIFCIAAFHHIPDTKSRAQLIQHIHDFLKKDGVLVLTVWNLFQWKYAGVILKALLSWLLHLGFRYAWNDVWVPWGHHPLKRYYHAFLPRELLRYFLNDQWALEEFYFTRKGDRVSFWRSYNMVVIARKR